MQRQDNHSSQDKADDDIFQCVKDKYDDPLEDSNVIYFEEDSYNKHQK